MSTYTHSGVTLEQGFLKFSADLPRYVTTYIKCTTNNYFIYLTEKS
jgi:hypothetical protein